MAHGQFLYRPEKVPVAASVAPNRGILWAFSLGVIQIASISLNTWQIAHEKMVGAVAVQAVISCIWVLGVKAVVEGSWWTRVAYVAGCCGGQVVGLMLAEWMWR